VPSAGGRRSLAAALIDNSLRLLANKLLKLAAAPRGLADPSGVRPWDLTTGAFLRISSGVC
jgi:hypothetical protein